MVDLNDCEREPIHIPGAIQPFGVLLALDEQMSVTQVSENVSDHLSLGVDEALDRPLSEIVDPAGAEEVRSVLREQRWHDANPLSIGASGKRFVEASTLAKLLCASAYSGRIAIASRKAGSARMRLPLSNHRPPRLLCASNMSGSNSTAF